MEMIAKRISVYKTESKSAPGTQNLVIQVSGTMPDGTSDSAFASGNGAAKPLVKRTLEGYGIHKADIIAGVLPDVPVQVSEGETPDGRPKLDLVLVGSDENVVDELLGS